ncbi:MAG: NAD-dependent epimerase/dehydratase family protein [Steroidobacteraceae bacterium]
MVTGATGFTGGHLARTLKARGHEVRALVRDEDKAQPLAREGIEIHAGNLVDADAVMRAADGCDVVYHIAAVYREAKHPPEYYRNVNVEGTRNIIQAAERGAVGRLVHCSTVGVHGNVKTIPGTEDSPFSPGDIYQATKLEAELLVQERIKAGLPAVIFRPTAIYGPGDTRFLKLFKMVLRGTFRMIGAGDVYYHMTYVSDLVDGIILCGEHPNAVGQTYIFGGRRYRRLSELVDTVAGIVGKPVRQGHIPLAPVMAAAVACEKICKPLGIEPILYPRRLDFFIKNRAFSIQKAQHELGYQPKMRLQEGLTRTFNWYCQAALI